MRNHAVYFEIYGKKMKARVLAKNENDAKQKLFEKIKFHKIELEKKEDFNEIMDVMDGFLDALKGMSKK